MQVSDKEQKMVKQCLEVIFGGFVVVSCWRLHSHLKEGVFATITEELKKEWRITIITGSIYTL